MGRVWWVWVSNQVLSLTRSLSSVNWVFFVVVSLMQSTQYIFVLPSFRIIIEENHDIMLVIGKACHVVYYL